VRLPSSPQVLTDASQYGDTEWTIWGRRRSFYPMPQRFIDWSHDEHKLDVPYDVVVQPDATRQGMSLSPLC
jgi:hypothetical protein